MRSGRSLFVAVQVLGCTLALVIDGSPLVRTS